MARLPDTSRNGNNEIFTMRISKAHKDKLEQLAKKGKYGGSASSAIRYMIEYHSRR